MVAGNWKTELKLRLEDFVDTFVVAGAEQAEVYDALAKEIENLRSAYERDPDPAEDDVVVADEPANDWPSA
jgi:hypothetical protein